MQHLLCILAIVCLLKTDLYSQPPDLAWAAQISGQNSQARMASGKVDADGNYYVVGQFSGILDFNPLGDSYTGNATNSMFVAKYNTHGKLVWHKIFDIDLLARVFPTDIALSTNKICISANVRGEMDVDPGPNQQLIDFGNNQPQTVIIQLDLQGNFNWAAPIQGTNLTQSYDVEFDHQGNVVVLGFMRGKTDFDSGPGSYVLGMNHIFNGNSNYICKLSPTGKLVWAKIFHGAPDEHIGLYITGGLGASIVNTLSIDKNNNIIYGSSYYGDFIDFDPGPGSLYPPDNNSTQVNYGFFILKLNPHGELTWVKPVVNIDFQQKNLVQPYNIKLDSKENIYCLGVFDGSPDFDPGLGVHNMTKTINGWGVFILKLNKKGAFVWSKKIENSGIPDIVIGKDDGLHLCGEYYGSINFDPGKSNFSVSDKGAYILKMDENGTFQWGGDFPNDQYLISREIEIDTFGNLYLGGYFTGTMDMDPGHKVKSHTSIGSGDGYIIKLGGDKPIFDLGNDTAICFGDSLILNTTLDTFKHQWNTGDTTAQITIKSSGLYIANVSSPHGITSDSIHVIVGQDLQFNLGVDTFLCQQQSIELSSGIDNSTLGYQWNTGDTSNNIIIQEENTYFLTLEDSIGCTFTDTINIINAPSPTVYIGPDTAFCGLFEYQLSALSPKEDSVSSYTWNNGDTTPYNVVRKEGLYHVQVKNPWNCPAADTMQLSKLLPPKINLHKGNCTKGQLELNAAESYQEYINYQWSTGEQTPAITVYDTGWYRITLSRPFCVVSDSIHIQSLCPDNIWHIPTAFTPNQDALNEGFKPIGEHIKTYQINIYNRWGELIFKSEPNQAWNGYYKNLPVSTGAYLYTLNINFIDGNKKYQNGVVNVVR